MKKTKNYVLVEKALNNEFGKHKELQKTIKDVLARMLKSSNLASEFVVNAEKAFIKAGFADKQKFLLLSKALMINNQLHNIIVLLASGNFKQLRNVSTAYDDSLAQFKHILSEPSTAKVVVQDARLNLPQILQRDPTKEKSVESHHSVEKLSAQLVELSLIVNKTDKALRTVGSRKRSSPGPHQRNGDKNCSYYGIAKHEN